MSDQIRYDVLELVTQKTEMEKEIKQWSEILAANGVGMNEPLVDCEGFPLNNIDIYQVRHARHKINCLQNDHKQMMKKIEYGLHGYYSAAAAECVEKAENMDMERRLLSLEIHDVPFAKITEVLDSSPAFYANLLPQDLIVEFGSVNHDNFRSLNDIATVVKHSEGQQINVKIKRNDSFILTYLIPKKWQGKGLLGCNIVTLD